jgi:hypothetical protein
MNNDEYAMGGTIDPAWTVELYRYLATSGCTFRYFTPAVVVAQHTYTQQCDGFHPPGPCPFPKGRQ